MSEPTVTVLAIDEPEIMPNRAEPKIETFAGPPEKRPVKRGGEIDEEAAEPDARRQHAEQHVMEDVGRDDAERDAVDALAREIEVVDDAFPGVAGMRENARQRAAVERVDHQHDRDDRQRPADAAARRLQQHHDHDRAHDPVDRIGVADAELEIVEDVRDVEAGDDGRDGSRASR